MSTFTDLLVWDWACEKPMNKKFTTVKIAMESGDMRIAFVCNGGFTILQTKYGGKYIVEWIN